MTAKQKRTIVICLDGGTFNIIRPMIDRKELPNISTLMKEGIYGNLTSTIPPETPAAFVTFMTGLNPGKHGITRFRKKNIDWNSAVTLNSTDIACKTIWERISEHGKKLIVAGVPLTFPPIPINGAMLSHNNYISARTHPPHLIEKLGKYPYGLKGEKFIPRLQGLKGREYYNQQIKISYKITEKARDGILFLMDECPWDTLVFHCDITDFFQHHFWKFMDPEHPKHDPESPAIFQDAVFEAYRKADEIIGAILNKAGKDANVLIMSDHGFGPIKKFFYINQWLARKGYLKFKRTDFQVRDWEKVPVTRALRKILYKTGLSTLTSRVPWIRLGLPVYRKRWKSLYELVDWEKTYAYGDNYGININMKGREPYGVVSPGEDYQKVSKKLMDDLKELREPEASEKIVEKIFRKEDIYSGPLIDEGTDIIPIFKDGYFIQAQINGYSEFDDTPDLFPSGHHVHNLSGMEGILILKGEAISTNGSLGKASLYDLAPTIYYLMGLPIPGDLEGRVLLEAIRPDYLKVHPVIREELKADNHGAVKRTKMTSSEEEDEAVKEQLRSLGYL